MTEQEMEDKIIDAIVTKALAEGYLISVNDGLGDGEWVVQREYDKSRIIAALRSTGCDTLRLRGVSGFCADIELIYGNSGWDVVHDCSVSLVHFMAPIDALIDELMEAA